MKSINSGSIAGYSHQNIIRCSLPSNTRHVAPGNVTVTEPYPHRTFAILLHVTISTTNHRGKFITNESKKATAAANQIS